jgi:thymidylate kinase
VRDGFLTLAAQDPQRFLVLDGSVDPTVSAAAVLTRLAASGVR